MITCSRSVQTVLGLGFGGLVAWAALATGCNPNFISSLGGQQHLPVAPGQSDSILVRFLNAAAMAPGTGIQFATTYRVAGGPGVLPGPSEGGQGLVQGEDIGMLIPCSTTVITVGNVDDPSEPGAWLSYNPPLDPVVQALQPLGEVLHNGTDFRCGDTITFVTVQDSTAKEGYSITWNVLSGQDQGEVSGPDAFAAYDEEVQAHRTIFGVP